MAHNCFQLMRAVRNPHEATLYLRTRAERISIMFLFHLTLILQKATSLHTPELQLREGPCVSVRVGWSGTESYITSVSRSSACAHRTTQCQHQTALLCVLMQTQKQSSVWVSWGKERCPGLSHPSPPMEKNVQWIIREYGSRTLWVGGSTAAPHVWGWAPCCLLFRQL